MQLTDPNEPPSASITPTGAKVMSALGFHNAKMLNVIEFAAVLVTRRWLTWRRLGIARAVALGLVLQLSVSSQAVEIPEGGDVVFGDSIAPILQSRCLSCHNDLQREGSVSLQRADEALDHGWIVPGDPGESRLIEVIEPIAGHAEMPKQGEPLPFGEREALRRWIAAGANWPEDYELQVASLGDTEWWSFQPLESPPIPTVNTHLANAPELANAPQLVVRTPIDAFINAGLHERGLRPAGEADRRTLLRRLTYDLIGLPPTPLEVERFVKDTQPLAYERVVDRLLASKHYGERWARHWLDVVKYADTCGYDKDKMRPSAWPYRDYVVRSFNSDKPFERFVQEQVAGDILFPGEPDGVLGLGFLAAGPWDFIGHVEVPESKLDGKVARNLDRDDMVSGTLNTFCSLTVQCARCHQHKFDPITQQQYYGLQAIFAAVDRAERPYDLDPSIEQSRRAAQKTIKIQKAELEAMQQSVVEAGGQRLAELSRRVAELQSNLQIQKGDRFGYHSSIAHKPTKEKWVEVDLGEDHEIASIVLHPCHDDFAGIGAGFGFPRRYAVSARSSDGEWSELFRTVDDSVPNPGLTDVSLDLKPRSIRFIRVTAIELSARRDDFIFALAELEALGADGKNVAIGSEVAAFDSIEAPARWGRSNLTDGDWATYSDPDIASELKVASAAKKALLAELKSPEYVERQDQIRRSLEDAESIIKALPAGKMVYAAATHFEKQGSFVPTEGKLRPIHVLHRGEVSQPLEPAIPGMLPLVPDHPWQLDASKSEGQRRAALAQWLTDPRHPLVWRSIVNRIWQYHFGRGIVATPNDFGRMGSEPTHPALLDWLACQFRDGGQAMPRQSIKALHRLIVTSSVYRQSSEYVAANAEIDSSNLFLWRMNRRRLEAEEIRDSILAVSGALNRQMGGPAFHLFELERTEHSPHYEYHKFDPSDPRSHRRSIYRFIVRSQPDPWMTTLDCADSSQSTPRRNETLTALQALSLLNSRFNLVMAQRFAAELAKSSNDPRRQVALAFRLVAQRDPESDELDEMHHYAQQFGMNNLCRFLFNLSEFIYLD